MGSNKMEIDGIRLTWEIQKIEPREIDSCTHRLYIWANHKDGFKSLHDVHASSDVKLLTEIREKRYGRVRAEPPPLPPEKVTRMNWPVNLERAQVLKAALGLFLPEDLPLSVSDAQADTSRALAEEMIEELEKAFPELR